MKRITVIGLGVAAFGLGMLLAAAAGAQTVCAAAPVYARADSLIAEANRQNGPRKTVVRGLAQRLKTACPAVVPVPPDTGATPPPDPVALPTPTSIAPGQLTAPGLTVPTLTPTFSWSAVTGATGYVLAIRNTATNVIVYPSASGVGPPIAATAFTLPAGVLVGSSAYKWDVTAVTSTSKSLPSTDRFFTTADTTTTPIPPAGDIPTILALIGPTKTVAATAALGPPFSSYDAAFLQYLPASDAGCSPPGSWCNNYYDRGVAFLARYARTGDTTFRTRGNAITVAYRKEYLEPNNYGTQPHWSMVRGLELHYKLTGDTLSRRAVAGMFAMGGVNFTIVRANGKAEIEDTSVPYMDNRIQARVLQQVLSAHRTGASFNRGDGYGGPMTPLTWAPRARDILTRILSTQNADGSYSWIQVCHGQINYMVGMLNDVFLEYWNTFEQDARIPGAVERANEYLWTTQWKAADGAFSYASVNCAPNDFGVNVGGVEPAGDLNGLLIASFGWLYQRTGDPKWKTRGDAIMAGLVSPRWATNYTGSKQYNQAFAEAYRYLGWR